MFEQLELVKDGLWPKKLISYNLNYLVVAGGGGGGTRYSLSGNEDGGGGGAGGYRASGFGPSPLQGSALSFSNLDGGESYVVTVGAGGSGAPFPGGSSTDGSNSIFNACGAAPLKIESEGGGDGGTHGGGHAGNPGGSGGGGTAGSSGGSGNTPPVSPPQGNDGGTAPAGAHGGGGGGATGAGGNCGPAGAGAPNDITGSALTYAVGGTGGACGAAGTTNRGNGADGRGNNNPAGNGGSGVVVIRGPSAVTFAVAPGTNSTSTHPGGDKIATFTVSGTLTVS